MRARASGSRSGMLMVMLLPLTLAYSIGVSRFMGTGRQPFGLGANAAGRVLNRRAAVLPRSDICRSRARPDRLEDRAGAMAMISARM